MALLQAHADLVPGRHRGLQGQEGELWEGRKVSCQGMGDSSTHHSDVEPRARAAHRSHVAEVRRAGGPRCRATFPPGAGGGSCQGGREAGTGYR